MNEQQRAKLGTIINIASDAGHLSDDLANELHQALEAPALLASEPVTDSEVKSALLANSLIVAPRRCANMKLALEGFAAGRAAGVEPTGAKAPEKAADSTNLPLLGQVFEGVDVAKFDAQAEKIKRMQAMIEDLVAEEIPDVPVGWQLVPVEPTEEMIRAGCLSQQAMPEYDNYEDWFNSHTGGSSERIRSYLCKDYRALLSAAPQPAAQPAVVEPDLHSAIMNLPCSVPPFDFGTNQHLAYKLGHRDARHAAAELAATKGITHE